MKKTIAFLLFLYGTVACAITTQIVNETPYQATLVFNTKGTSITLQPHEGFLVPDKYKEIPLHQVVINKNNYGNYGHGENLVFNIGKTLYPYRPQPHGPDVPIAPEFDKKSYLVINLQLITLSNEYLLYLEEAPLFRDKDKSVYEYKYPAPMIFSYQHNQYGNQYGNIYDGIYGNHGDQYGHNYGNQHNDYINQYPYNNYGNLYGGYNDYGNQYQPYNDYGNQYQYNPNQYGNNYNPYGNNYF